MSDRFQLFLKSCNTEHRPTSGYAPQDDGRAERAISTLKERMQSLLSDSSLRDNM